MTQTQEAVDRHPSLNGVNIGDILTITPACTAW